MAGSIQGKHPEKDTARTGGFREKRFARPRSDEEPGIWRRRSGRRFSYTTSEGERLSDPEALARIKSLAIPPA